MQGNPTKPAEPLGAQDIQQDDLLSCKEVARFLKVTEECIAAWRRLGRGPAYVRYGRRVVRYRRAEVLAWVARHEVRVDQDLVENVNVDRAARGAS